MASFAAFLVIHCDHVTIMSMHCRIDRKGLNPLPQSSGPDLTGDTRTPSELMARCNELYGLWGKYEAHGIATSSNQDTAAEVALSDCRRKDFTAGIAALEHLLDRDKIPFPPKGRG